MKVKVIFLLALGLALALPIAAQAAPQNGDCGLVSYTLTPNSGPAGTMATASGTGALSMDTVNFYWDMVGGTMVGSASVDQYGNFTANINIPMDATLGVHNVVLDGTDAQENPVECPQPFTVVAAAAEEGVQPDAYPAAGVTTLPSTGLTFVLPAAGLLIAGTALLARKRR